MSSKINREGLSEEDVEFIKESLPPGSRVVLEHMCIHPFPVPDNTIGTVLHVDDAGRIHCLFDNGRSFSMDIRFDCFYVLDDRSEESAVGKEA